jgi:uncharacterized membrane protein
MRRWTEERMEQVIGGLLRVGVLLAGGLVFAGAVLYLARHGGEQPDYSVFHGQSLPLRRIVGDAWAALDSGGRSLIQLGLLTLVATPIVRVLFSAFAFAAQGDRRYVVITLIVLAALGFSLLGTPL